MLESLKFSGQKTIEKILDNSPFSKTFDLAIGENPILAYTIHNLE